MRKVLLSLTVLLFLGSWQAMGQCGTVSLIGEFTGWADDHMMTRNPDNPAEFTTIIMLSDDDDTSDPPDGIVEMKFRENKDWAVNWGSAEFPSGTGEQDGSNIPVPVGIYYVTFNCSTAAYTFTQTGGNISLIGEFNGWADDHYLDRSPMDFDQYFTTLTLVDNGDTPDDTVEVKFRQNADWGTNWGNTDFPTGQGVINGPNIKVPTGTYSVMFEWTSDTTCNYNFTSTCGTISMIGEFNGWSADYPMMRSPVDPDTWYAILSLDNETADGSDPPDGIAELKFRMDGDWAVNWGSADFPSGTGTQDGANIPVPLDGTGLTTDYNVMFNCATGAYTFLASSGQISMIGAFNDWNGDVDMYRDPAVPNVWHLTRSWFEDSEVKFRENHDWTVNWGNSDWPTGTGLDNGPNIPLVAGTYDVTFNWNTLEYSFTPNNDVCGEILVYAFFDPENPTAVNMVRDPMHPSQFNLTYNFTSSTTMFFKMDDGQAISNDNIWGGVFPCGNGVHDVTQILNVPGGKYDISFNCQSGDFCFTRLGNAVIANKVFDINVDGNLNDSDWDLNQNISRIVDGTATDDVNTVDFGVTYNDTYLFVGMNITDAILGSEESGELFVDGDKSGGAYDDHDLYVRFSGAGVEVIEGPDGYTVDPSEFGFMITGTGYSAEVAIRWADLGVTPEEGGQIGFDVIIHDDDDPLTPGTDYAMAWNGDLNNYTTTSGFGDLVLGSLSCGCISVYNETIGDVILQNPTDMPTTYVGTYNLDDAYDLVFRKDEQGTVTWATDSWPTGTAVLGGPAIPGEAGKVRVTFDCLSGEYNFDAEAVVPDEGIALSNYTDTPATIDGDLSEYSLDYDCEIQTTTGQTNNNEVTWGSRWDKNNLYVGVKVVDGAIIVASVNPWENDAIEFYVDGNNDKDGTYDADYDTQLIMDVDTTGLWIKADGVQIEDYEAVLVETSDGYNVEMRLSWADFGFAPGRGRVMGWSLGNNDTDTPDVTREYQTVWYGTGANWNNTALLGDMQLANGPYYFAQGFDEDVLYNANILLYPNPTNGNVFIQSIDNVFTGDVSILVADISGRVIMSTKDNLSSTIQLSTGNLNSGIYFVNVLGQDGKRAVKKLIVQ